MTHYLLYWLGTGWWSLGLAYAQLLRVSKTYSLRLSWSGGSSAHSAAHPWLLIAWATFWLLILYGPLPLGARLCLIVSFSSFSLPFCSFLQFCNHFLPFHYVIPAVMLFDPNLLDLFGSADYSSLNDSIWSFRLCITLLVGFFVPFIFSWASLAHLLSLTFFDHFSNFAFPWVFTNSFELPWPNYLILHPWDSWACHQLLTFFACITSGLCDPFSLFYITYCPWVCYFSLPRLL